MSASLAIPSEFNGPVESGNGGYSSGIAAGLLEGPAEVTLRRPVPLDRRLDVERDGAGVRLLDDGGLVIEAREVSELDLDVPAPVSVVEARRAAAGYRGSSEDVFRSCFVCGRARADAFGVNAGAVEGRGVVASPWTPPAWTANGDGRVRDEFVWAVLDCPTYFALYMDRPEPPLSVLGRFTVRVHRPVVPGEEYVVMAWPIEIDGRKHHAGSALLSPSGEVLAVARALLIEPRG